MRRVRQTLPLLPLFLACLPAAADAQSWSHFTDTDEMTGEEQAFATSARTGSTRSMGFPYGDVEGWLGFGCDGQSEWAYIGFNEDPNLVDTDTHDGYDTFRTRVKWDDHVTTMSFMQEWGDRFVHFQSDGTAIARMGAGYSVLVELDWYGSNPTYFRFSLDGSADAIAQARAACKG